VVWWNTKWNISYHIPPKLLASRRKIPPERHHLPALMYENKVRQSHTTHQTTVLRHDHDNAAALVPPSCVVFLNRTPMSYRLIDSYDDTRYHKLQLYTQYVDIRPILTKIRLDECWLRNSSSQHQTSPSRSFINIGPLPSIFARKFRSLCKL
jgi:hypothetical protein